MVYNKSMSTQISIEYISLESNGSGTVVSKRRYDIDGLNPAEEVMITCQKVVDFFETTEEVTIDQGGGPGELNFDLPDAFDTKTEAMSIAGGLMLALELQLEKWRMEQ